MFFILSKLYSFLLTPYIWLFILLLLLLIIKNQQKVRRLIIITFCGFLFFSNSFIVGEFVRVWEYNMRTKLQVPDTYDVGIVLGGGMATYDNEYKRIIFWSNTDRILQAVDLYKEGKIKKILISSASGRLFEREQNESRILKPYLIRIGIPEQDIIIDTLSDNTRQNALESKKVLSKEYPGGKYLLITSAIHMRRAIGCFRGVGLAVTPYPTNKIAGHRKYYFDHLFIPNIDALGLWSTLAHEVFGYIIYAAMGYL
jgi:uncharacterized SAM-binding protein YcdF (DUF218 family)